LNDHCRMTIKNCITVYILVQYIYDILRNSSIPLYLKCVDVILSLFLFLFSLLILIWVFFSLFFFQYLTLFIDDFNFEVFEQFMQHLSLCADSHCAASSREQRRIVLTNLFISCDHSGVSQCLILLMERSKSHCYFIMGGEYFTVLFCYERGVSHSLILLWEVAWRSNCLLFFLVLQSKWKFWQCSFFSSRLGY
jgi:hypothetical protein